MKVTVVAIDKDNSRIDVKDRNGREYGLDLFCRHHLLKSLKIDQVIQVKRQTNNPYLVPMP